MQMPEIATLELLLENVMTMQMVKIPFKMFMYIYVYKVY